MKWIVKAVMQKTISALPSPESVNYLFQSRVTKKLPMPKKEFLWRVGIAVTHFKAIQKHRHQGGLRGYEFGAGWAMIIPLTYYALGIDDQTLVDIRPNLRLELVADTICRLNEYRPEIEHGHG